MESERPKGGVWLLLLVLALIWGSSFILMKRGLFWQGEPVLTPWQLATVRLSIAWLTLSPILFRHGGFLRKHWLPLMGSGLLGNGIPAVLFAVAQTRIDSALSGMLNSLTTLMTLIVGVALFRQPLHVVHLIGVLVGLAGAVGLIALSGGDGFPDWSIYAVLPIIGTLCYGFSGNIVKRYLYSLPPTATSALALTFVGPVCIGLALGSGLPETLATNPHAWASLGYVTILAVMSSALALVLWNILLQRTTAVRAASVTYLMPVVAIGWGLLDGEMISWAQVGMIGAVLGGVYLVSVRERRT